MKKYNLIIFILLLICSCESDPLEKTIFIPDEKDDNLPAYTEWGYNSFGAKYERMYFVATNFIVPCKVASRNGILNFSLSGRIGNGYYLPYHDNVEMSLTFSFPMSGINEYEDLIALHKKEIDLTGASCEVKMTRGYKTEVLTVSSGRLNFKRAQLLRVDDKKNRVILSGVFNIRFLRNDIPEVMSDGRFDLGITEVFNLSE